MPVGAQVSSMSKDTEVDGRGCSQIEDLGCQHPGQQVSAEGLQGDPGLGLWKATFASSTLCYSPSSCYNAALELR